MKKLYMAVVILAVASLAGCTFKAPATPEVSTGEILTGTELTGAEFTGIVDTGSTSAMEEFTGEFDAEEVPTVAGSEGTSVNTGVVTEVDTLIEDRNTQPKDDTKLTEEDITLMEEIIEKIQDLGK